MTNVKHFFEGYEDLRYTAGSLKMFSRAFETTGNSSMAEELLCLAEEIMVSREKMLEEYQASISQGVFKI